MFNFNTSKHGTKADTDHPIHGHTQSDAGHLLHHHTPQESAGKVVLRPGWGAHCTHTHTHTHTHTYTPKEQGESPILQTQQTKQKNTAPATD